MTKEEAHRILNEPRGRGRPSRESVEKRTNAHNFLVSIGEIKQAPLPKPVPAKAKHPTIKSLEPDGEQQAELIDEEAPFVEKTEEEIEKFSKLFKETIEETFPGRMTNQVW